MALRLTIWYLAALAMAVAVTIVLQEATVQRDPFSAVRTGWCAAAMVCQLGAAWYFVAALSGFKHGLKVAYVLLAVGAASLGVAQLQLPLLVYFDGWKSFYSRAGLVLVPYLLTSVAMYAGVRQFAQQMSLRLVWMKLSVAAGLSLAGIGATVALFWSTETSTMAHVYNGLIGWTEAMGLACVLIAFKLRSHLAPAFRPAMSWLIAGFLITMLAGLQQLWLQHLPGEWDYRRQGWSYWLLVLAGMVFLRTGLQFRELKHTLKADAQLLDVVLYAAGLISRPEDVSDISNRLRPLTARLAAGAPLTAGVQKELIEIYLDIEAYLVTKEPLRKFTVHSLRISLPHSFVELLPPGIIKG